MIYLLDTNALSDVVTQQPQFALRIAALQPDDRIILCAIVRGEVLFGVALAGIPCEPVPTVAADAYARVKLARRRIGLALDDNDCWIAATALVFGATLVTRDADFRRVDGLSIEDWST